MLKVNFLHKKTRKRKKKGGTEKNIKFKKYNYLQYYYIYNT